MYTKTIIRHLISQGRAVGLYFKVIVQSPGKTKSNLYSKLWLDLFVFSGLIENEKFLTL
jgi:hypothetical protein